MLRSEYLAALLRRDFIRYIVLAKPKYTSDEVSARLRSLIDADSLYRAIRRHIEPSVRKFVDPEKLRDADGNITDNLPEWFTLEIADKVVADYEARIAADYSAAAFLPDIISAVERFTWIQGVDDMAVNLSRFRDDLRGMAAHYADIREVTPSYYDLREKFEAAREITLGEWILQNNDRDVSTLLDAFTNYCRDLCGARLALCLSRLYADLAASPELSALIDRYHTLHHQAESDLTTLSTLPSEPEWEAEYRQAVPLDFFERNLEAVDAPTAFRMIIISALSRDESALIAHSLLTPARNLRLFTNPTITDPTSILPWLAKQLFS